MHYTDKRFTLDFIRHFDVHALLSIVRRADIELKLKGVQGYKAFVNYFDLKKSKFPVSNDLGYYHTIEYL